MGATQELQLLDVRTELEPNKVIKDHRYLQIGASPEAALVSVWKCLEKRYHTPHKPSHLLVQQLTHRPIIKDNDTAALFSFHIHCQSALDLRQSDLTTLLDMDNPSTIDSMVNRLDSTLSDRWFQYQITLPGRQESPTFADFAEWIERQADISRYQRNSRPITSTQSYAEVVSKPTTSTNPKTTRNQNTQKPPPTHTHAHTRTRAHAHT